MSDSTTLYEFSKEYIQQKKDEGKVSWERDVYSINNLLEFFGPDVLLSSLDAKGVSKYKTHRLKTRMPETINHELICLGAVINLAIDWEIFKGKNPVYVSGLIKFNRTKRRILTHEEQILLLNASSEHFQDIIIGALNTAMRRGEVVNAKITDLNLDQKYIFVPAAKTTEPRIIPLNKTMLELIPKLKQRSKCEYLFTTKIGKKYVDANSISLTFRRLCKKTELEDLTFHSLRHTAATRMLEGKTDNSGNKIRASLVDVQLILGHKNPKTTMIYLNPDESLKDAVNLLN
ncbi:MAG: tyrosine-type recombinase/integrase [Candidatus Dadabacteria bacterium]|nr:tyrosine-type recombinase/integrase [Candidatus Dadabacteria bacterium]